MAVPISDDISP